MSLTTTMYPPPQLHTPLTTLHRHHLPCAHNERDERRRHPRTGKTQWSLNARLDPLPVLGGDVFHLVLSHLPIPALLAAEVTCAAWHDFIRNDAAVWRQLCLSHNVLDTAERCTSPSTSTLPDYRAIVLARLPMNKAWTAGRARIQHFPAPRDAPTPVVFLPELGVQVRSATDGLRVASWPNSENTPPRHFTAPGVSQYNHLDASGRYIVGMRVDNQKDKPAPKALPTRIDVWRIIGQAADNNLRLELVAPPLQPRVWGKSLRLRTNSNRKTDLAVLASKSRLSGKEGTANSHWVGDSSKMSVHVWHLDERMRHEVVFIRGRDDIRNIELDDSYIFVPALISTQTDPNDVSTSHQKLFIYERVTGKLIVTLDVPATKAAVSFDLVPHHHFEPSGLGRSAGGRRRGYCLASEFRRPYAEFTDVWSQGYWCGESHLFDRNLMAALTVPAARDWDRVKCRTTATDLLCTCATGGFMIVRNYRTVLAAAVYAASAPYPTERTAQEVVDMHTIVVGTRSMVYDIATWGERAALRILRNNKEYLILFETGACSAVGHPELNPAAPPSTDLPSLPRRFERGPLPDDERWTEADLKARNTEWYSEFFSPLDGTEWPRLGARIMVNQRSGVVPKRSRFQVNVNGEAVMPISPSVMFMDRSGVYMTGVNNIKAYTFGRKFQIQRGAARPRLQAAARAVDSTRHGFLLGS